MELSRTGFQLVSKVSAFYGTRRFTTVFTSGRLTEITYDHVYTMVKNWLSHLAILCLNVSDP
jgi:hypothetical protein